MQIFRNIITDFEIDYPLDRIAPLESILFLDIETTGFTARSSMLYLIGTAYYKNHTWYIEQFFAEKKEDEPELLHSFFKLAKEFTHIIHFNGNNFDLPYLMQKVASYKMSYILDNHLGIDIYRRIAPYKSILRLPNSKQKTLELYLGIERIDPYHGGELISVYHDYLNNPEEKAMTLLLQHNFDDMKGMLSILPIMAVYDLFNDTHRPQKVQSNCYTDLNGNKNLELYIKFKCTSPLPKPISHSAHSCFFSGDKTEGVLRVPIFEEEMKYFYSNYKNYYYLPQEDVALHKSIATFVDKEHRIAATASTCYTRKYSLYLPQWDTLFEPFFKREYNAKDCFFELTDEMKTNREFFTLYIQHVLFMLSTNF